MKTTKIHKFAAWLLMVSMLMTLIQIFTFCVSAVETQGASSVKAITLGASVLKDSQESIIYFGTYQQSSLGSGDDEGNALPEWGTEGVDWIKSVTATNYSQGSYYSKDPIKWRVLSNSDGKALLLSDRNLDVAQYHTEDETVTWAESTMRSWLNGLSENKGNGNAAIDYSADGSNFLTTAFSTSESTNAIAETSVANNDNPTYTTDGGNETHDKIFLLSIAEVQNSSYGFINDSGATDTRKATNTAYVYGGGKHGTEGMYPTDSADYWWLRSPGDRTHNAAYVFTGGYVYSPGNSVNSHFYAVRPAFNLNLSSVLFTSAASGGKLEEFGEVATYSENEWKVTVKDSARSGFTAKILEKSDSSLTFSYSGAKTGDNEYISAIVKSADGIVTHYGRLKNVTQNTDASGTLNFDLSILSETDSLYIFNEQYNGDYKTDFASEFVGILSDSPLVVSFDATEGTVTVTSIENLGTDLTVFVGAYNSDDELIDAKYEAYDSNGNKFDVSTTNVSYYKVFVWDENQTPKIDDAIKIEKSE